MKALVKDLGILLGMFGILVGLIVGVGLVGKLFNSQQPQQVEGTISQ